ncbi:MAG: exosortase/archaeosortase family protein [Bryobacteraceae bacterium]|nr:exosortase/archaeosortase family protein [Bryobacteraceae bacterium]
MSSVAKPVLPSHPAARSGTADLLQTLAPVFWFGALLILCYLPILRMLVHQWNTDEDMGHGFFVPVVAGYIAWQKRDELQGRFLRPNYLGLLVVFYAAIQGLIGSLGAELFLSRTAFVEAIVGSVLFLGGWHAIRVLSFPLALLIFMIPIPAVIYNQITFPLQIFASQVAAFSLDLIGIPVLREGNVLELPSQKLSVVEACSGIRSLLSLSFLSLVYAYFFDSKPWMRWALLIATIPIAILANAFRVTITGVMSEINPELAHGFMHTAQGWVIFMIALIILVMTHQLIDKGYKAVNRGK